MLSRSILLIPMFSFSMQVYSACVQNEANVVEYSPSSEKRYEIVKEMKTWTQAASCAVERGGYLIHIEDAQEQSNIYNAITTTASISSTYASVNDGGGIAYVWIGATDKVSEGNWIWDGDNTGSGTQFWYGEGYYGANNGSVVNDSYHNWGGTSAFGPNDPNEPDDYQNNQDGAAVGLSGWPKTNPGYYGSAGEWNDIALTNSLYFIIEFDGPASCSAGSYSTDGKAPCTLCSKGYYQPNEGQTSCTAAPTGSYVAEQGATKATECSIGSYSDQAASSSCTLAPAGSFVSIIGATEATMCSDGYYSVTEGSASCNQCPAMTISNETHTDCVTDADSDGVADSIDNCPNDANYDQKNTDGLSDGGDVCDLDDDEDGYTDSEEIEAGTSTTDPNDYPKSTTILKILPLLLNQE